MHSDKFALLDRINNAISKKWCHRSSDSFTYHLESKSASEGNDADSKDLFAQTKNAASIERIEQRIEGLERQNNQLLHFIDFLVENLPDLVMDILNADQEKQKLMNEVHSEIIFPGSINAARLQNKNEPCPTRREMEILDLLVKGFCAKEIANRLFISETTVITHKKNLKGKFNAKNTAELISKVQAHLPNNSSK